MCIGVCAQSERAGAASASMGPAARPQADRNTSANPGSAQSSAHHLVESSESGGRKAQLEHPRRPGHHQGHAGEDQHSGDPAEGGADRGDGEEVLFI